MSVLFQLNGVLPSGKYLLGHYAWGYPVRLTGARLTGSGPTSGTATVALEVGGSLTGDVFTVAAGDVSMAVPLAVLVPAQAVVRWVVTEFTGPVTEAATAMTVTLDSLAQSIAQTVTTAPALTVGWVNGAERLTLFTYDPATRLFTDTGLATGRATIDQAVNVSISIQGVVALAVTPGRFAVNSIRAAGGVGTAVSPRLEFQVDGVRIATLTPMELAVAAVTEAMPGAGLNTRFEFAPAGILVAALSNTGLIVAELEAPI